MADDEHKVVSIDLNATPTPAGIALANTMGQCIPEGAMSQDVLQALVMVTVGVMQLIAPNNPLAVLGAMGEHVAFGLGFDPKTGARLDAESSATN